MNYIQVPLLVRVSAGGGSGRARPFVFAGPAIAIRASCDFEFREGGVSTSVSCDEIEESGAKFKSVDYGVIVGAGLAFDVNGKTFSVGARYDHSLADINDGSGIKHRVISLMATFEFPWMK